DRADTKKVVVLGHPFHGESQNVADGLRVRPGRFGRVAPDNLITREVSLFVRFPTYGRVRRQSRRESNRLRSGGRRRQRGQRRRVHAGHVSDVIKVIELWQVSVLNSILHADVLMLVLIILVWLSEADSRKAAFKKR